MGQTSPSSTASLQPLSKRLWGLSSPLASQMKGRTQARLPSAHWTVMSEEDGLEPSLRMRSKTNTWLLIKMITALTLLISGDLKGKPSPPQEFPLTWATNPTTNIIEGWSYPVLNQILYVDCPTYMLVTKTAEIVLAPIIPEPTVIGQFYKYMSCFWVSLFIWLYRRTLLFECVFVSRAELCMLGQS